MATHLDALAAKYGGRAGTNYDALAAKHGGVSGGSHPDEFHRDRKYKNTESSAPQVPSPRLRIAVQRSTRDLQGGEDASPRRNLVPQRFA